jgi:AcrR family transcriptional regulator
MPITEERAEKRRGRVRSAAAESAVLRATLELLNKKPLRDVTTDAIARRAGVSKATIYKWWPHKSHVALDAFLSQTKSEVPTPDTGSVLKDFSLQLRLLMDFYTSPRGRLFRQFLAEGQCDRKFLGLFRERFLKSRRDAVRVILERGIERGEIRADIDSEIILDLIYGPSVYRLLTEHAPVDEAHTNALIQTAFTGLQRKPGNT